MLGWTAMLTWPDAHRVATIASAQAHHDYGVDVDDPPIDVNAAISAAGLPLMWRPLPRLFGAYLTRHGMRPGVLVSSSVPVGSRRHTAAHELGHHQLGHSTAVDDGSCLQVDAPDAQSTAPLLGRPARWSDAEKVAEAFAAWFLMPRRAVDAALQRLGLQRPASPVDVYRLSLLLGTPYRSTARHLPNLRRATPAQSRAWMRESPSRIKANLDPTQTWHGRGAADIWAVDRQFNGTRINLQQGDQLIVWHEAGAIVDAAAAACRAEPYAKGGTGFDRKAEYDPGAPNDDFARNTTAWTSWLAPAWSGRDNRTVTITVEAVGQPPWSVHVIVRAQPLGLDTQWIERMETRL